MTKVKCIKDLLYEDGDSNLLQHYKDVIYEISGERVMHSSGVKTLFKDTETFEEYFEVIPDTTNNPPYVRVYFYPNGDENKGFIKAVEGWLENDYPSNLAILTKDGCLCKFKFIKIEQMYPVKEPSDVNYDNVYKINRR